MVINVHQRSLFKSHPKEDLVGLADLRRRGGGVAPGLSGLEQALLGGDGLGGTRQVRRRLTRRPAFLRGDLEEDPGEFR